MYTKEEIVNKIITGDTINELKKMPSDSVDIMNTIVSVLNGLKNVKEY